MLIRLLGPFDGPSYRALRLQGLQSVPTAFSASLEEERDSSAADLDALLVPHPSRCVLGAFVEDELSGIVGVGREAIRKMAHKAWIRSLYVAEGHRGRGIAESLLNQALEFAASLDGVRQVTLAVTEGNQAALALYQKLGFKVFGIEPDSLCIDGVFYRDIHMVRSVGEVREGSPRAGQPSTDVVR